MDFTNMKPGRRWAAALTKTAVALSLLAAVACGPAPKESEGSGWAPPDPPAEIEIDWEVYASGHHLDRYSNEHLKANIDAAAEQGNCNFLQSVFDNAVEKHDPMAGISNTDLMHYLDATLYHSGCYEDVGDEFDR